MADLSHFTMIGFGIDIHDAKTLSQSMSTILEHCDLSALSGSDFLCVAKDKSGGEIRRA